jgi:hypothetical protein
VAFEVDRVDWDQLERLNQAHLLTVALDGVGDAFREEMHDDLLAQAERAIRESQLVRDKARKDRMKARTAVARAHDTLHRARVEGD